MGLTNSRKKKKKQTKSETKTEAQGIAQNLSILDGLIGEQRGWAKQERIQSMIDQQEAIINEAQSKIDTIKTNHREAPGKIQKYQASKCKLLARFTNVKNSKEIDKLQKLMAETTKLAAELKESGHPDYQD